MKLTRDQIEAWGRDPETGEKLDGSTSEARPPSSSRRSPAEADAVDEIEVFVPGRPHGKQRPRVTDSGTYTPKETTRYEKKVAQCAERAGLKRWDPDGEYRVELTAIYPDSRRADVDNIIKAILDGLNGVLWADDRHVTSVAADVHTDRELGDAHSDGYVAVQVERIRE